MYGIFDSLPDKSGKRRGMKARKPAKTEASNTRVENTRNSTTQSTSATRLFVAKRCSKPVIKNSQSGSLVYQERMTNPTTKSIDNNLYR